MSRWYNYRAFEEARANAVLGQGVLSINPANGKLKVGDNHTKWKDLPELGGGGDSSAVPGFRAIKKQIVPATPGLNSGPVVVGHLVDGEHVFIARIRTKIVWDSNVPATPPTIKLGVPGNDDVFSSGSWSPDTLDEAAGGDFAAGGFLSPAIEFGTDPTAVQDAYAPPAGLDIIFTLDDGAGNPANPTVGESNILMVVMTGF